MKITAERETGFGAGVLFIAEDTKRALWLKRSDKGDFGGYWCCPGGGVEDNETIEEGVRRECREEIGFDDPYILHHMHRTVQPGFVYHNHLAFVSKEFTPILNEEHTEFLWSNEIPKPVHPALMDAIEAHLHRMKP